MAYIITDGKYYIFLNDTGHHRKTKDRNKAIEYKTVREAIEYMLHAPCKTVRFYVYDDVMQKMVWRHLTEEEKKERLLNGARRDKNGRIKRKHYSKYAKEHIYNSADGRCQLCGRRILYADMTLDHIIPLAVGGMDSTKNLQAACMACNKAKADFLPDEWVERITEIFLYQMGKRYGSELKWDIIRLLVEK